MDPQKVYDSNTGPRQTFLQSNDKLLALTYPELMSQSPGSTAIKSTGSVLNGTHQQQITKTGGPSALKYDSSGTLAFAGLASTAQSVLFPSQAQWCRLNLSTSQTKKQKKLGTTEQDINAYMEERHGDVMHLLQDLNYQASMGDLLLRVLLEDNVLVVVFEDMMKVIPLHSFVCKRYGGKVQWLCYKEEVADEETGECEYLYTYVNYKTQEVWQKVGDNKRSKKVSDLTPRQHFVVTSRIPAMGDYVSSFGMRHYNLIFTINNFSFHLARAAAIAAKAIMMVKKSSNINPSEIANLEAGQGIIGDADAIQWLSAAMKIGEWSWVDNYIDRLRQQLSRAFALDLLNQPQFAQPRSASEVQLMAQAIDAHVASLIQSLQHTLVKPLVEACLEVISHIQERQELIDGTPSQPDVLLNIKPTVTSGTSQFDAMMQYQKLLQGLAVAAQFDETLKYRIDSEELLKTFTAATGIDTSHYIKPMPTQLPPGAGGPGQPPLSNPPQIPPGV